ncbi:MAG TPA: hypothetical protein VMR74_08245 [Gammaproteobacteria bacterium]|nr:hypothetical protein [Gammaproteobacteria bacterium]
MTRTAGRRAVVLLHVLALLTVVIELHLPLDYDGHGVERVGALDFPASYAIYGFTACVALVLLGRWLRRAVMRGENYYDGER